MITTDAGAKIGKVTWRSTVWIDDGIEPRSAELVNAEYPVRSKGLAKVYVEAQLKRRRNGDPEGNRYWGEVVRGSYVDDSFEDAADGAVTHASWEPSETSDRVAIGFTAFLTDEGRVTWHDYL
jgi:hypothetical protein